MVQQVYTDLEKEEQENQELQKEFDLIWQAISSLNQHGQGFSPEIEKRIKTMRRRKEKGSNK